MADSIHREQSINWVDESLKNDDASGVDIFYKLDWWWNKEIGEWSQWQCRKYHFSDNSYSKDRWCSSMCWWGYFNGPVLCADEDTSPDDDFDVNLDEYSFQRMARELRAQRLMKKLY